MEITDLTGLAKLADAKLPNKAYDDALSKPAQQVGELGEDVAKTFRLLTFPIRLAAAYHDRLEVFLDNVRGAVPAERQIEAEPSIAGPIIQNLIFLNNDNPLIDLYQQLLTRAIDKERRKEAHPAFVRIIEQLSADEALILWVFHTQGDKALRYWTNQKGVHSVQFPLAGLTFPEQLVVYISHLESLNLIEQTAYHHYLLNYHVGATDRPGVVSRDILHDFGGWIERQSLDSTHMFPIASLTDFGRLFGNACIPTALPDALKVVERNKS